MRHINFLPWRARWRYQKNVRFLIYLALLCLLVQFACVGYWQYLKERSVSRHNIIVQQSVSRVASPKLNPWSAYYSLYHYIALRSQQRDALIRLLPYFKKHQIVSLKMDDSKWQARFVLNDAMIVRHVLENFSPQTHHRLAFKNKQWQLTISEKFNE